MLYEVITGQTIRHNRSHYSNPDRTAKIPEQLGRSSYDAQFLVRNSVLCSQREYRHTETKTNTEDDP